MRQRKKSLTLLFISIFSFLALIYMVTFIAPTSSLQLLNLQFPTLILFFLCLSLFLFSITTFLFKSKIHGLLLALFVVSFLVFRLTNLTHPFFFILLAGLFLTLELLFTYRK